MDTPNDLVHTLSYITWINTKLRSNYDHDSIPQFKILAFFSLSLFSYSFFHCLLFFHSIFVCLSFFFHYLCVPHFFSLGRVDVCCARYVFSSSVWLILTMMLISFPFCMFRARRAQVLWKFKKANFLPHRNDLALKHYNHNTKCNGINCRDVQLILCERVSFSAVNLLLLAWHCALCLLLLLRRAVAFIECIYERFE